MATPDDDIKPDGPATGESGGAGCLLARPLPPGYRAEWARHIAAPRRETEAAQASAAKVLIFRLGREWLALPAELVTEITEPRRSHSLPHRRDRLVRGIVNVRGELLVKVALGELLGTADAADGERGTGFARLVVIGDAERRRVAFEADEVHGLHRCMDAELRPLPATVERAGSRFTDALIDWQGHAVGRLDGPALLDALGRGLA